MGKAIISNRIYLDVTPELKTELIKALTYKIEKKRTSVKQKITEYEIIKNYKIVGSNIMSIPQGRLDLIPEDYEVIDKRVEHELPFPLPKFDLREDQAQIVESVTGTCIINALVGWGRVLPRY